MGTVFPGCAVALFLWMADPRFVGEEMHGGGQDPGQTLRLFLWVAACLVVIYALSVGPALRIAPGAWLNPNFVAVYAPLDGLYKASPVVRGFYDWYLHDLWKVK